MARTTNNSMSNATTSDDTSDIVIPVAATKAQKKKKKSATKLAKEAANEATNKAKCIAFETQHRINAQYDLITPPAKPFRKAAHQGGVNLTPGEYVFVEEDKSPYMNSEGGYGYIHDFVGTGPNKQFTRGTTSS